MRRTLARGALGVLVTLGAAGCSGDEGAVTVLAAASLADVMPQIVSAAQADDAGAEYEVSYAGSAQIVQQLNAGAPADVVVLAGQGPLESLDPDLAISEPTVVATNTLVLVLAPGNPAGIEALEDLARDDVSLVLCAEQMPCGGAAAQMLSRAKLSAPVASFEPDVRATLAKVASGEADVGVVYVTDDVDGDLASVPVPEAVQVRNRYPALSVAGSARGAAFVSFLTAPAGQDLLARSGFGPP